MSDYDEHDDLDRALFALPLEEPPAGLRASILRATVFAAPAVASPLGRAETVGIGIALALAAWLAMICLTDRAFVSQIEGLTLALVNALADPRTLLWLGLGAGIALAASFVGTRGLRLPFAGR